MKKIFISIIILVIIILIIAGWFVYKKILIKEDPNAELIKVMAANNCRLLPGDPGLPFPEVAEDDKNFSVLKERCEIVPNCEMKQLGGLLKVGGGYILDYTCCPKDFMLEDPSNPGYYNVINPKYKNIPSLQMCGIIIN